MSDAPMLDIEEADRFDPTAEPEPLPVARRLHELTEWLDAYAGRPSQRWDERSEDEREDAVALAMVLIALLREDESTAAERYPEAATGVGGRRWAELAADEQEVAKALVLAVLTWLLAEGGL